MATFPYSDEGWKFQFIFFNHTQTWQSPTPINWDLRTISDDPNNSGEAGPNTYVPSHFWFGSPGQKTHNRPMQYDNITVVGIGHLGQPPLVPAPIVRFWLAGGDDWPTGQNINLLDGNGYTVTQDTLVISEVTGNGFRITLDGGGTPPRTDNVWFQVYKA